jgi:hypothetical protein
MTSAAATTFAIIDDDLGPALPHRPGRDCPPDSEASDRGPAIGSQAVERVARIEACGAAT